MAKDVLFVCTGNMYRSQVAELLFNKMFPGFHAESGGTRQRPVNLKVSEAFGEEGTEDVLAEIEKLGFHISNNSCKSIRRKDLEKARIIFVMERRHKEYIEGMFPGLEGKIFLLAEFAGLGDPEIPDSGPGASVAEGCALIKSALEKIRREDLLKSLS